MVVPDTITIEKVPKIYSGPILGFQSVGNTIYDEQVIFCLYGTCLAPLYESLAIFGRILDHECYSGYQI